MLKVGQEVKVAGLDMDCHKTVELARVEEILDPPQKCPLSLITGHVSIFDCVILTGGISVLADSRDFLTFS